MAIPAADIVAFSPHPDDVELGCGGGLALAAQQGQCTVIVCMTNGEHGTRGNVEIRERETTAAAEILGISEVVHLALTDTKIGTHPNHRDAVVDVLQRFRPKAVLAPHPSDRHPDHEAASRLVKECCFLAGLGAEQQRHRPADLFYYTTTRPFEPSFVLDVSTVWEKKLAAIRAHRSQLFAADHELQTVLSSGRYWQWLEARSRWFGAMIAVDHGEPYFSDGPVGLTYFPMREETVEGELPGFCSYGP